MSATTGTDSYDSTFLDAMAKRVLVGDGAMGTMLQAADLTLDDFNNLEGCNEILNDTRPEVLAGIHRAYFEAGADAVETNTFGCNLSNLGDYDIAAWDRVRSVDLDGVFYGLRYQLPAMVEAGGGAIVNMSSVLGSVGIAQNAAYVASKHALVGLTKVAALEYTARGVRTNAVGQRSTKAARRLSARSSSSAPTR